jgi:excisionase family DNA binding protein
MPTAEELRRHHRIAVLRYCRERRENGYMAPIEVARLREELLALVDTRQESSKVAQPEGSADALFVSRSEYARRLGISPSTVDRRIASGEISVLRLGRRVLIPVDQGGAR